MTPLRVALLVAAVALLVLAAAGMEQPRLRLGWLGVACAVLALGLPVLDAM